SRIDQLPQVTEAKATKSPVQYQFNALDLAYPTQWKTIQPEKKMGRPDFSEQKGYVNLGAGAQTNTYGNGGFLLVNDAANKLSLTFDHRLINDTRKIKQTGDENTVFSTDNALQGNYGHEFEKSALEISGGYKHSAFNYFGQPSVVLETFAPVTIYNDHQIHNRLFLQGEMHSLEDSVLEYKAMVKYGFLGKKLSAIDSLSGNREHHILIEGEISGRFMENSRIGLDFGLNNFVYQTDKALEVEEIYKPENYGLFEFTPHYDIVGEKYNVRLGFKSEFEFAKKNVIHLAPSISGKWEFADRFFLIGELGGGSKVYSFEQADAEYRYLNPAMRLKDTFTPLDATISFRTNAVPGFGFELLTGYKSGEDYFMTSEQTGNRINVLTPHQTEIKQTKIGLLAEYKYDKIADLTFKLMKYSYKVDPEETITAKTKAWGKPDFELSLDGDFHLTEKVSAQMNYYLASGRYALVNDETVSMKPISSLNIGSRYAFNKKVSAFAQLNNLLFQKYDLWYGMPAQSFNFIAGIGLTF
ncbi:MAG: TonB-dependent receptor, partial [Bacteroidota bacterium]|nr:TonB-dependent receptor [Bacteroidota bacterium]